MFKGVKEISIYFIMALNVCDCCLYSTRYNHVFERHIKSKRHIAIKNTIDNNQKYFKCKNCNKNYGTQSGLWKHSKKCIPEQITTLSVVQGDNREPDKMDQLSNQIMELKKQLSELQPQLSNIQPSITNNTSNNNTTNYNNIHVYLNTHCSNAMSIDQFVESMHFVKDDFQEIDNNRFYYQGATSILKKYFQQLKPEDRPMHCAMPLLNRPTTFFVKSESEWKEECQSMIHYQMKYIEEFENKDEQMAMTRFFERFNEKLYETYKELSTSDKRMEKRINDKMMGGGSRDKIDMLDELVDSKIIKINVNEEKN
jgi:regulator of replication initiation timing